VRTVQHGSSFKYVSCLKPGRVEPGKYRIKYYINKSLKNIKKLLDIVVVIPEFYKDDNKNQITKGLKMNYQERILNDDLTMKELKNNTYLMFRAIGSDQVAKDSQVWIKESNSYCRESKKYFVVNCADLNKSKLVDGSKKVFTSFTY
jgi:hypothetical protein